MDNDHNPFHHVPSRFELWLTRVCIKIIIASSVAVAALLFHGSHAHVW